MTPTSILEVLDEHAAIFDFPMLDNEYMSPAAIRFTAFRALDEWLLVFEEIGILHEEAIVDVVSAYGSHLERNGRVGALDDRVRASDGTTLTGDKHGVQDARNLQIRVGGRPRRLAPSDSELRAAGITDPSRPPLISVLRLICMLLPHEVFATDRKLLELCGRNGHDLRILLQSDSWRHPDLAAGETPSSSPCLSSLAEALAAGVAARYSCPPELHNTHWSNWERPR